MTTLLLNQLQAYFERQDDLEQLMDLACQSSNQVREEVVNILLTWVKQEIIPQQNEELFEKACSWLMQLVGLTLRSLVMRANLCQQFAVISKKALYIDNAISCLKMGFELEPTEFHQFQFWGTLLVTKARWQNDVESIESAIELYTRALARCGLSFELLWDQAVAWQLLYEFSIERTDLQKALSYFARAQRFAKKIPPYFFIDYSKAWHQLALSTGDPAAIKQSIANLKKLQPLVKSLVHLEKIICELLVSAQTHLALLTDDPTECEHANSLYEETITGHPELANLWVHWGHLFLNVGWKNKHVPTLEAAVEKLTSLKIAEADPVFANSLLGQALMALGVLIDDLTLIAEGTERVTKILQIYPHHPSLLKAEAFSFLTKGLYFNDAQNFAEAVNRYTLLVTERGDDVEAWLGLAEAYAGWGKLVYEGKLITKACQAMVRLTQLRPFSFFYHRKIAELLLLRYRFQSDVSNPTRLLEQAIKHLQLALSLKEDVEVLIQLALTWDALAEATLEEGYYLNAIQGFEMLHLRLPTDYRLKEYLGTALMHYGIHSLRAELLFRAAHLFEQVLQKESEHASALGNLGMCKLVLSEITADPHDPEEAFAKRVDAENLLKRAVHYGHEPALYHLARLYSMKKLPYEAVEYLKRAKTHHVLPSIEHMEQDTWLDGLRQTVEFQEFLSGLRGR